MKKLKNNDDKPVEKPGAPKPENPVIPGSKNEICPSFAYEQLEFRDMTKYNNRDRVTFFVRGEQPFFIETFLGEFLDYQRAYFELFSGLPEGDICRCDVVEPPYELMTYIPITSVLITVEDNKEPIEKEVEDECPLFFVFDLSESLKVGNLHKHQEDSKE